MIMDEGDKGDEVDEYADDKVDEDKDDDDDVMMWMKREGQVILKRTDAS